MNTLMCLEPLRLPGKRFFALSFALILLMFIVPSQLEAKLNGSSWTPEGKEKGQLIPQERDMILSEQVDIFIEGLSSNATIVLVSDLCWQMANPTGSLCCQLKTDLNG